MNDLFLFDKGYGDSIIVGVDEAGRGPIAGPVVAAAVIIDKTKLDEFVGVNDSKLLSESRRLKLFDKIVNNAAVGIGIVDNVEIDRINILNATFQAMRIAISNLNVKFDKVLVDGNLKIRDLELEQEAIIKGDSKSLSIAAASIIAKVTRDKMMQEFAKTYPLFGLEKHKGYPTKEHIQLVIKHGPSEIHRLSFLTKIKRNIVE